MIWPIVRSMLTQGSYFSSAVVMKHHSKKANIMIKCEATICMNFIVYHMSLQTKLPILGSRRVSWVFEITVTFRPLESMSSVSLAF